MIPPGSIAPGSTAPGIVAPESAAPSDTAPAPAAGLQSSQSAQAAAPALQVLNLSHSFTQRAALRNVSFSVPARSIHGFVGPNGAGKTTSLKILATLLPVQLGKVKVLGLDVTSQRQQVRPLLGYMPDHFSSYKQMTVWEYLEFFAAAYGLNSSRRQTTVRDVLELTDLAARRDEMIKGLSRGMQQRLSLARVLVNDPQLLLLDEPASGLDPRARIELMEILQELRRLGKTIFISSHILAELATLCDSVTIIDRGSIRYSGTMAGLLQGDAAQPVYRLTLAQPLAELVAALQGVPGVLEVHCDAREPVYLIRFDPEQCDSSAVLGTALAAGAKIVAFAADQKQLNQAFLDLTEPGVGA